VPLGKEVVVIAGATAELLMSMFKPFLAFPALLVAMIAKFEFPAVVGVPVIAPVDVFKLRPAGRLPVARAHVIGVVPVAVRV